jgi:flagellar basal-body rod protein FlgB
MALPGSDSNTRVYEVDAEVKGNGNTVDLENQMSELTKNGIQYLALVEFINSNLKTLRYSISEGGKV